MIIKNETLLLPKGDMNQVKVSVVLPKGDQARDKSGSECVVNVVEKALSPIIDVSGNNSVKAGVKEKIVDKAGVKEKVVDNQIVELNKTDRETKVNENIAVGNISDDKVVVHPIMIEEGVVLYDGNVVSGLSQQSTPKRTVFFGDGK